MEEPGSVGCGLEDGSVESHSLHPALRTGKTFVCVMPFRFEDVLVTIVESLSKGCKVVTQFMSKCWCLCYVIGETVSDLPHYYFTPDRRGRE